MKTIFLMIAVTFVFIISMCFVERQRTISNKAIEYEYSYKKDSENNEKEKEQQQDEEEEPVDTSITVSIEGEITTPGTYTLENGDRLLELIELAGGVTDYADSDAYNLDYVLENKQNVYIPKSNNNNKISINTGDAIVLDMLPGIGTTIASRIVSYRENNGPFMSIETLLKVEGIGDTLFNKIKDYIRL